MLVSCGRMQSVSCPADDPLQPLTASCADGASLDTGTSLEGEIRRYDTHALASEQKLEIGQCGLRVEAAVG